MKIKPILGDMSGRLQGIVASHNRGGQYLRGRTVPITPPTTDQTAARINLSNSTQLWTQTLSSAQREAWDSYAVSNPQVNGFGDSVNIGGIGWFNKTNTGRLQVGLDPVLDAPVINGPAFLTIPTVTIVGGNFSVAFDNTDDWASDGGALALFQSRWQSVTRNSAAGIALRFAGAIIGAATPPTTPQAITPAFAVVTGQRVFLRFVALGTDGRRSADYRTFLDS